MSTRKTIKTVVAKKPRAEILREAAKKYRTGLLESGRITMKTYVKNDTNKHLKKLKQTMELDTIGDVIDVLVLAEIKRRNIR